MICDLAYVDKSVSTGNHLGKSAERHERYDLHAGGIAYGILLAEDVPGIGVLGLVAERNSALFAVKRLDINLDNIANIYNLGRMTDASPGKLAGMYHTVNTAQIHESAVIGKALNGALVYLTDLNLCPERLFLRLALLSQYGSDGSKRSLALFLDLDDLYLLNGAHKSLKRVCACALCNAGKGSGDEYANGVY